ncbi:hypothetical protein KC318_g5082 [Hortaea werneckii]|nr:hypothetical protein KC334_g5265 [Hortaea werneckii]KAI7013354.1 hypothetical protein KC355_g5064 [Hortaea werneckii]KAI7668761.1 hypothetical protein KC318_g5082 [Hortaea werneckii]
MAKTTHSNKAELILWIIIIILTLSIVTALTLAFGFPDFTCAHVPALATWADNFLWCAFVNLGSEIAFLILISGMRYPEDPDQLPSKESDKDSLRRQKWDPLSRFGRYDRYALACSVYLITIVAGTWVRQVTMGMAVDCTQWKAAANGGGLQ